MDLLTVHRMKNGDEEALESFVRKYYPDILCYCHYHVPDQSYAEDLTQETFARFFRTLDGYQHYGKALNYLYVIAGNVCRDFYRRKTELPIAEIPEMAEFPDSQLDLKMDVRLALNRLPGELREVTILYYYQDRKQTEIARILGISLPLVKYRLKRAKELLGSYLGKEEYH